MSNYKPRIESNNLDLTSILSTINELPEAGGSTAGYCNITIQAYSPGDAVAYIDPTNTAKYIPAIGAYSSTYQVRCGSMLYCSTNASYMGVTIPDGINYTAESASNKLLVVIPSEPMDFTITVFNDD